jgi:hypothetical protein
MRCCQCHSMLVQNTVEVRISVCIRVFQALLCVLLAVVFLYSCVLLRGLSMYFTCHTLEINAKSKRNPSSPSVSFSVIRGNPDPIHSDYRDSTAY